MCLLLGLGAFRQRRRPALVSEETNTEAQPDTHLYAGTHSRHDSLMCLQDDYGGGSWKHDTAYQGDTCMPCQTLRLPACPMRHGQCNTPASPMPRLARLMQLQAVHLCLVLSWTMFCLLCYLTVCQQAPKCALVKAHLTPLPCLGVTKRPPLLPQVIPGPHLPALASSPLPPSHLVNVFPPERLMVLCVQVRAAGEGVMRQHRPSMQYQQ